MRAKGASFVGRRWKNMRSGEEKNGERVFHGYTALTRLTNLGLTKFSFCILRAFRLQVFDNGMRRASEP